MDSRENNNQEFGGDKKESDSPVVEYEMGIAAKIVPKFPQWIETYHLTLLTLLWSVLIILFGYLSKENLNWLWLSSLMIIFQYLSDLFDGKLGKYRKTGLIKWGYYMDHFLDFIFLCVIIISYAFLLPAGYLYILFFLTVAGAFMVNSFLLFSVTNKFEITFFKIGPTEGRAIFIILNTLIIFFGSNFLKVSLPYIISFLALALIIVVFSTQKKIWKIDMDNKNNKI